MEDDIIESELELEETKEHPESKDYYIDPNTDQGEKILELSFRLQRYCQKRMIPIFNHPRILDHLLEILS